LFRPRDF